MNESFYKLSKEKQEQILQAGYHVFSNYSYRKAPMIEVATKAGVSKSLLFHYFKNKKEYYLFLWRHCAEVTEQYILEEKCYEKEDLFSMMIAGLQAKIKLMNSSKEMTLFVLKHFFEKDEEVVNEIHEYYEYYKNLSLQRAFKNINKNQFKEGIDINLMIKNMFYCAEGYLFHAVRFGKLDIGKIAKDFKELVHFWEILYKRGEGK